MIKIQRRIVIFTNLGPNCYHYGRGYTENVLVLVAPRTNVLKTFSQKEDFGGIQEPCEQQQQQLQK
jgi:hypothetical protein